MNALLQYYAKPTMCKYSEPFQMKALLESMKSQPNDLLPISHEIPNETSILQVLLDKNDCPVKNDLLGNHFYH